MPYRAPVAEHRFLIDQVFPLQDIMAQARYGEMTPDLAQAILTEAGRLCDEVIAPLQRAGDKHPARLENGVVRTSPGFAAGYRAIAEGGWVGMAAAEKHGGMGLPMLVTTAVNEMMAGACMALQLNPMLTQGQIEALELHASDALQALYLPRLTSGEWTGTMNLTEPQAGSDVGALRSTAQPRGDGSYAISGQKIFITWGDTDFAANTCHLVLARLPDGVPGTKGISLFLVPKYLPDAAGAPGIANSLKVVSLEHKLGIHGSPTAVMQFDAAQGWLVGAPHQGMRAMFDMMNNARLGVAAQGVGVAEAAFQAALAYARARRQGLAPGGGGIIGHADVRRMLATMKAEIFAARAIVLSLAQAVDLSRADSAAASASWAARAALLTPIAKAFATDIGVEVANLGVQIHGGMGFIEETGAAQFLRDVRITPIYEGTNGIQAMDLAGRKMMDGGAAAFALLDGMQQGAEAARVSFPTLAEAVWTGSEALREATEALNAQDLQDRFAGAVPYLRAFARVLGGHYHLQAAMAESGTGKGGGPRAKLAQIYITRLMPEYQGLVAAAGLGAADLYALSDDDLAT